MKKLLLGTSAVVGAAMLATAAQAQDPIQVGISGFLNTGISTSWHSGDLTTASNAVGAANGNAGNDDSINMAKDWTVVVGGSTTLENGLSIGVTIEIEDAQSTTGNTASNDEQVTIDEVFVSISGGFGQFRIGNDDPVITDVSRGVVGNVAGYAGESDTTFAFAGAQAYSTPVDLGVNGVGNASTIWYRTPRFAGLQLLGSYTPDSGQTATGAGQANSARDNVWSFGLDYAGSFGAVDVAAGFAFLTANTVGANAEDIATYTGGVSVGFGGATIGAGGYVAYGAADHAMRSGSGSDAYNIWVGATYGIDKLTLGTQFIIGEVTNINTGEVTRTDSDGYSLLVNAAYALGPGISVGASFGWTHTDYSEAAGINSTVVPDEAIDSFGLGTTLNVSF